MSGWRAERARGGGWVAAKVVREDVGSTTAKVRRRRALAIPPEFTWEEAQAHVRRLVARGELE